MLDLLPHTTRPWRIPIRRRHQPTSTSKYQDFRPCLRWEFGFSCAFCLLHESDLSEHGLEGWGLTWIEHMELRSEKRGLIDDYANCVYVCRFCNQARGAKPLIDSQQRRLLNPCHTAWGQHFALHQDEIRALNDDGDAVYTFDTYDLNDRRKVRMRWKRRTVLSERLDMVTQARPLHDRLMQRARDTGDPTLIDDAELAYKQFLHAWNDLLRFQPIPDDADRLCACTGTQHCSLPEVLQEQILRIDASPHSWSPSTPPATSPAAPHG